MTYIAASPAVQRALQTYRDFPRTGRYADAMAEVLNQHKAGLRRQVDDLEALLRGERGLCDKLAVDNTALRAELFAMRKDLRTLGDEREDLADKLGEAEEARDALRDRLNEAQKLAQKPPRASWVGRKAGQLIERRTLLEVGKGPISSLPSEIVNEVYYLIRDIPPCPEDPHAAGVCRLLTFAHGVEIQPDQLVATLAELELTLKREESK